MKSRDFVYWLQGFFEIARTDGMTKEQVDIVKRHLNLVFKHEIDPAFGDKKHQDALNKAHAGDDYSPGKTLLRC